jgi:hypothetical protein
MNRISPRRPWLVELAALMTLAGCSALPNSQLLVCGNHILEPGEECDNASPHCGQPDAGVTAACRIACNPAAMVACPSGYACGLDRVCRLPSGTYTVGPGITIPGAKVAIVDLDGDAAPDLVARGLAQISIYHNDGSGQMTLQAEHDAPIFNNAIDWLPQVRAAPAPTHLLAEFSGAGVNQLALDGSELTPLIVPNAPLPLYQQLVGTATRPGDATPALVMIDGRGARVVAYAIAASPTALPTELTSTPFAGNCAAQIFAANFTTAATPVTRNPSLMTIATDKALCAVTFNAQGQLVLQQLDAQRLSDTLLLDVDGDGLTDVLVTVDGRVGLRRVWLQTATGFQAPVTMTTDPNPSYDNGQLQAAVADFNGDGRDDWVLGGAIYLNRTQGSGTSFSVGGGFVAQPGPDTLDTSTTKLLAGDLNGDGHADLVAWGAATSFMTCLGDGKLEFSCAPAAVPFTSLDQMLIGDVNGDSLQDLVLVQTGQAGALTVFLGKYLSFPEPVSEIQKVTSSAQGFSLVGAVLAHDRGHIAAQLIAVVDQMDLRGGLAIGKSDAHGVLEFAQALTPVDVALDHFTSDAQLDLAALTYEADGYHVRLFEGGGALVVDDFPLGVATKNRGASLGQLLRLKPGTLPVASAPTDNGSFVAQWNGSQFVVSMLPELLADATSVVETQVDLDGDGQDEIVEVQAMAAPPNAPPGEVCALRVLARSGVTFSAHASSLGIICNSFVFSVVPPFVGHLGLDTILWPMAPNGPSPTLSMFVQGGDYTFTSQSFSGWPFLDASRQQVLTPFSSHVTSDFNRDGLPDFVMVTLDGGVAHIALSDPVRR